MTDKSILDELHARARAGQKPSELLRHIAAREGTSVGLNRPLLYRYLKAAFGLSLYDVHLVGGWSLDGEGEVPDARIDASLTEKIKGWVDAHPG